MFTFCLKPFYFRHLSTTFPHGPLDSTLSTIDHTFVMCKSGCLLRPWATISIVSFWLNSHWYVPQTPPPLFTAGHTIELSDSRIGPGPPTNSGLLCDCAFVWMKLDFEIYFRWIFSNVFRSFGFFHVTVHECWLTIHWRKALCCEFKEYCFFWHIWLWSIDGFHLQHHSGAPYAKGQKKKNLLADSYMLQSSRKHIINGILLTRLRVLLIVPLWKLMG